MNTNMAGVDGFQKLWVLVVWAEIASALEGLRQIEHEYFLGC